MSMTHASCLLWICIVEAPVVAIVDHEMFVYEGKRTKALPKAKWRFLARY